MEARYWIEQLALLPHPEGGFYKETYRCTETFGFEGFDEPRNICTAIYFLLETTQKSHFHKIKSDELWFYHAGNTLEIIYLTQDGPCIQLLGPAIEKGERLQVIIPKNVWFASRIQKQEGYSLVSCTVAPGFDFNDFEMAKKQSLLTDFPNAAALIDTLCLDF